MPKPKVDDGIDKVLFVRISKELMDKLDYERAQRKTKGRSLSRSDLVRETLWELVSDKLNVTSRFQLSDYKDKENRIVLTVDAEGNRSKIIRDE